MRFTTNEKSYERICEWCSHSGSIFSQERQLSRHERSPQEARISGPEREPGPIPGNVFDPRKTNV